MQGQNFTAVLTCMALCIGRTIHCMKHINAYRKQNLVPTCNVCNRCRDGTVVCTVVPTCIADEGTTFRCILHIRRQNSRHSSYFVQLSLHAVAHEGTTFRCVSLYTHASTKYGPYSHYQVLYLTCI